MQTPQQTGAPTVAGDLEMTTPHHVFDNNIVVCRENDGVPISFDKNKIAHVRMDGFLIIPLEKVPKEVLTMLRC